MVKIVEIPFTEMSVIPKLVKDFLSGNVCGFDEDIFTIENIKKKIESKRSFDLSSRELLQNTIKKQYTDVDLTISQSAKISSLSQENTFTITTGHQLNLFTGPVFFIYKILQTIKTADYLSKELPGYNFVPIFWMATEDHDFEEINHFKTRDGFYQHNEKSGGPVGKIILEDIQFVESFYEEFKDYPFGIELYKFLSEAYQVNKPLTEVIRSIVQYLFGEYGLVTVDGDDSALKRQMIPIFRDELDRSTLYNSTKKMVGFLENQYKHIQVNPREINLFYISPTRNRIERSSNGFNIIDKAKFFTKNELFTELETYPEKFSPNALMRPVYQESVLPNIMYIGGNAEIMYWLELKDYFKELNLSFPILMPRNSLLELSEKSLKKIEKNDLSVLDFFGDFDQVVNRKLLGSNAIQNLLNEQKQRLENQFEDLKMISEKTDQTFGNMVEAERTRQLMSFNRLEKRLLRAEKIKQFEKVQQLNRVFQDIHPGNVWQERVWNFSVFYAIDGENWLKNCFNMIDPTKSQLVVVMN